MVGGIQYECLNPLNHGVKPNPEELNHIELGYGLLSFRNFGFALFSTTKQIFLTGSSRLTVLYKQAINEVYVEIYFYSFIFLTYESLIGRSYVYLNIFFALFIDSKRKGKDSKGSET